MWLEVVVARRRCVFVVVVCVSRRRPLWSPVSVCCRTWTNEETTQDRGGGRSLSFAGEFSHPAQVCSRHAWPSIREPTPARDGRAPGRHHTNRSGETKWPGNNACDMLTEGCSGASRCGRRLRLLKTGYVGGGLENVKEAALPGTGIDMEPSEPPPPAAPRHRGLPCGADRRPGRLTWEASNVGRRPSLGRFAGSRRNAHGRHRCGQLTDGWAYPTPT